MDKSKPNNAHGTADKAGKRALSPQAERALAEVEIRRAQALARKLPKERDGPDGKEPTRYGDWERKGIVSDF